MFGIENLITIGIVLLLLIIFRFIDRNLRSVNRAQKFITQWERGLSSFIEEKSAFIKNFGIQFEVERKAAGELMRRIQTLTREELAQKVQALTAIDERIREYDTNLEELLQMTGRVQDNLNRLREESAYVEDVEKKVLEINEKFDAAEGEIDSLGEKLAAIEAEFEKENTAALERAVESSVSAARATIMDMEAEAQTLSRKVEEHREAVDKLERGRVERLARDEERIEKLLTEAVDRAGNRADKVEEAALAKLRDQAQERVNHIKTSFEEKIKNIQETVKTKITEINEQIKENREGWKTETASIEARQKEYTSNWKKEIQELDAFAKQVKEEWAAIAHKTGQELIATSEHRLEEYRQVQEEQYKQLASIANDTTHLEEELRRAMQDTENRVNGDFARFENEMKESWEGASNKIRESWEKESAKLSNSWDGAANKMRVSWEGETNKMRDSWESAHAEYTEKLQALRQDIEGIDDELRGSMQETKNKVNGDFARFENEIRESLENASGKMRDSWDSASGDYTANLQALRQELDGVDQELQGIKQKSFENVSKKLKGFEDDFLVSLSKRSGEIDKQLEVWQKELDNRLGEELEKASKDQGEKILANLKRFKDEASEFKKDLEETKKSMDVIRLEIAAQNNIAGQTDAVKTELEQYIKNMKETIDRISLLESETNRYDSQLAQIKRLEDDVNAKMTRFLSEKHRIEVMENDFTRLLQTSQSVEEKLAQVTGSDDLLQNMQVQLRRLEDAIKETEEKYKRVDKKSKTLDETNDGIDRNFKALQDNEQTVKRLNDTVSLLKTDLESIQSSIKSLSAENEKARDTSEKLSSLDENIQWLEKRIAEMNTARESLARLATELQNLEKKAKDQVKLVQAVTRSEVGHSSGHKKGKPDEGAPAQSTRENIKRLKAQSWSIDEIARALNISKGEVELILELPSKEA
jgi:chromosome segregation ATPase